MIIGRSNKLGVTIYRVSLLVPTISNVLFHPGNYTSGKLNVTKPVTAVLTLSLIPVVYAHNQEWIDGFKSGAVDGKTIGMGAGDASYYCNSQDHTYTFCRGYNAGCSKWSSTTAKS